MIYISCVVFVSIFENKLKKKLLTPKNGQNDFLKVHFQKYRPKQNLFVYWFSSRIQAKTQRKYFYGGAFLQKPKKHFLGGKKNSFEN